MLVLHRVRREHLGMSRRQAAVEPRVVPEWFPQLAVEVVAAGFERQRET